MLRWRVDLDHARTLPNQSPAAHSAAMTPPLPLVLPVLLCMVGLNPGQAAAAPPKKCDPAASWLAYAVSRGGGAPVTRISTSAVVPPLPTSEGAMPAIW